MFDRELVVGSLEDILSVCENIKERTVGITCGDEFCIVGRWNGETGCCLYELNCHW